MPWKIKRRYRDLLDREDGYVKKPWGEGLRVCLAYPNHYRTGMGNLGFHTVYRLFNEASSVLCERSFLPDPGEIRFFSPGPLPLFSLESQRPLLEFDIVAFSISFENDYPHVLDMLRMGGIPLRRELRDEGAPLVIAGGIAVTMNPEPLSDFVDLFLLGEAEVILPVFLSRFVELQAGGASKEELIIDLQKHVAGLYAPALYRPEYGETGRLVSFTPIYAGLPQRIARVWSNNLDFVPAEQTITSLDGLFGDMYLMEVNRGCPRRCRFCAAGHLYLPPRFRRRESLEVSLKRALRRHRRIGLVGTAVSDHPDLMDICRSIRAEGGDIAIGSLRVDRVDGELVHMLVEGGVETLALAPEAGSQRLRDLIKKGLAEESIMEMAEVLLEGGIVNVRLYFMLGLPTETDEDVEAVIDLTRRISRVTRETSGGGRQFRRVLVSVNQFIPKAGTPMQWYPLMDITEAAGRVRRLQRAFRGDGRVEVKAAHPRESYLQALLSLGDRRVGRILLAAHGNRKNWPQSFKASPVDPDFFVYRPKDADEMLPWDFIDHGIPKEKLLGEYRRTFAENPPGKND